MEVSGLKVENMVEKTMEFLDDEDYIISLPTSICELIVKLNISQQCATDINF